MRLCVSTAGLCAQMYAGTSRRCRILFDGQNLITGVHQPNTHRACNWASPPAFKATNDSLKKTLTRGGKHSSDPLQQLYIFFHPLPPPESNCTYFKFFTTGENAVMFQKTTQKSESRTSSGLSQLLSHLIRPLPPFFIPFPSPSLASLLAFSL